MGASTLAVRVRAAAGSEHIWSSGRDGGCTAVSNGSDDRNACSHPPRADAGLHVCPDSQHCESVSLLPPATEVNPRLMSISNFPKEHSPGVVESGFGLGPESSKDAARDLPEAQSGGGRVRTPP